MIIVLLHIFRFRGQATADFTESESEAGVVLRRRRRCNRSTETLTYAADDCWDGSQSTLSRCTRHAARSVLCLLQVNASSDIVQTCPVTRLADDDVQLLYLDAICAYIEGLKSLCPVK